MNPPCCTPPLAPSDPPSDPPCGPSSGPLLEHEDIAARIPHAGSMCLLDRVIAWDDHSMECTSSNPAARAGGRHPLADSGRLPAIAAVEYAAQAMALHGRLMQERLADGPGGEVPAPRRGYLAGLRSVQLHRRWIPADSALLTIRVERFAGDDMQVLYDFSVHGDGPIAQGRAAVVLDAGARGGPAP